MLHKKSIFLIVLSFLLIFGVWTVAAGSLVAQQAVLSGEVVSTVAVGDMVSEGSELVRVKTLAGSNTAARSNINGIVREVLVAPGSQIHSGDVVIRIEAR